MFAYNCNTDKKQGLKPGAYLITKNLMRVLYPLEFKFIFSFKELSSLTSL